MAMEPSLPPDCASSSQTQRLSIPKAPKNVFVWEDTYGLYHHCPYCEVPSSHTSSLLSACLGEHLMPCPKYHQNLFWPNKTHECDPCNRSREEHFKRHKAIATALRDLEKLSANHQTYHSRNDGTPPAGLNFIDDPGVCTDSEASSQRKGLPRRLNKAAKKLDKALNRTTDTITGADIARVANALHPGAVEYKGNEADFIELDDPGFPGVLVWDFRGYAWYRQELNSSGAIENPDFEKQTDEGLLRLGIDSLKVKMGKEQKSVVAHVRALVKADIENLWNEECETAKRRGGFLRFINQSALERIIGRRKERLAYATKARATDAAAEVEVDEVDVVDGHQEPDQERDEPVPAQQADHDDRLEEHTEEESEIGAVRMQDAITSELESEPKPEPELERDPVEADYTSSADTQSPFGHSSIEAAGDACSVSNYYSQEEITHVPKVIDHDNPTNERKLAFVSGRLWAQHPEYIPLPPPDDIEEADTIFFNIIQSGRVPPDSKVFTAEDFFQRGIYNIHNHDIWAPVQDTPLQPEPDPEEEFLDTEYIHTVDPKHPRWDDWKSFEKHFRRYKDHPSDIPTKRDSVHGMFIPCATVWDCTAANMITPMGTASYMTKPHVSSDIMKVMDSPPHPSSSSSYLPSSSKDDSQWSRCPDSHIAMMVSNYIVPFLSDTRQPPPQHLIEQFTARDGILAEQCWQWFLIGRLNAQNLQLHDGLRAKVELEVDANGTPLDEAGRQEFERLHGPVNDAIERVCTCRGLPTERMVRCAHPRCDARPPCHARCVGVRFAPPAGEVYLCPACERDVIWFLEEEQTMRAVGPAVRAATSLPYERFEPLARASLRQAHSALPRPAWAALVKDDFVRQLDERVRAGGDALAVPSPEELAQGALNPLGPVRGRAGIFAPMVSERDIGGDGEKGETEEREEKEEEKEKEEDGGVTWGVMPLGDSARGVGIPAIEAAAEAVLRWEVQR